MTTMDERYGDGSEHEVCDECGFCKECGDCEAFGCGKRRRKAEKEAQAKAVKDAIDSPDQNSV